MGKYLNLAATLGLMAGALWLIPLPWSLFPLAAVLFYQASNWFWKPNRACAALGAQFLTAQRDEAPTSAEAIARACLAQAAGARVHRGRLVCLAQDMLCTALLAQDKLEEAESVARQLMAAAPRALLSPAEMRPAQRTLAHVLLRRHKIDEAEALLRQLQDSILFREQPLQRGAVLSDLAALEAERHHPGRAAEWNTRAIHLLELHSAPDRDLAVLYMNRGDNHAHNANHVDALADYQKAIFLVERAEPENTTLALLLSNAGVAEFDLGQSAAAVKSLRRSFECWQRVATPWDPRFAMTAHNLAQALAALGQFDEAITFAERSLEVQGGSQHPDYPTFRQTLSALQAARPPARPLTSAK